MGDMLLQLIQEDKLERCLHLHLQRNVEDVMEVEDVKTVEEVERYMIMVLQVLVPRVNTLIVVASVVVEDDVVLAMGKATSNYV